MLTAIGLFDRDLWNVIGCGEDKIRVLDPVLASVSHPDDEGPERRGTQQVTDASFHVRASVR